MFQTKTTLIPALLNTKQLGGPNDHLQIVEDAISSAQKKLFPKSAFPAGVATPEQLKKTVYGVYLRALRDMTGKQAIYGVKAEPAKYLFGVRDVEVAKLLPSGLFSPQKMEIRSLTSQAKIVDGFSFSPAGVELMKSLSQRAEIAAQYTREGLFKALTTMSRCPRTYLGKEYKVELMSPLGLIDESLGAELRGSLVAVREGTRTDKMVAALLEGFGGFVAPPLKSMEIVLAVSKFSPGALFRLRDTLAKVSGSKNQGQVLRSQELAQEFVTIPLDEIFSIQPAAGPSVIIDAEFVDASFGSK